MREYSRTGRDGHIILHHNSEMEKLVHNMQSVQEDATKTAPYLELLARHLIKNVYNNIGTKNHRKNIIPIYIMRGGGGIMQIAHNKASSYSLSGLIVPSRLSFDEKPHIVYGDVPLQIDSSTYLLLDFIINTGSTMLACLESLYRKVLDYSHSKHSVYVVSVFSTEKGTSSILGRYPQVEIHTIWDDWEIGDNKRLVNINFDAGDYAFGGKGDERIRWERDNF